MECDRVDDRVVRFHRGGEALHVGRRSCRSVMDRIGRIRRLESRENESERERDHPDDGAPTIEMTATLGKSVGILYTSRAGRST